MLAVYRVGAYIPTPGIATARFQQFFTQNAGGGFLQYFDLFSGGMLRRMTIFALGITPYITASIILQLLTVVIPTLDKLQKEGEIGRRKITQWTRYLTVALAIIQSIGIALALQNSDGNFVLHPGFVPDEVPKAREQVAAMDRHVRALERRLGLTTRGRIHWVRGPLLGMDGKALYGLCLGSRPGEHPAQHRPAAHRLAGHADRRPGGPAYQVLGVRVERVEVEHGERRVEVGGRPVQPGPLVVGGRSGAHGRQHRGGPAGRSSDWDA